MVEIETQGVEHESPDEGIFVVENVGGLHQLTSPLSFLCCNLSLEVENSLNSLSTEVSEMLIIMEVYHRVGLLNLEEQSLPYIHRVHIHICQSKVQHNLFCSWIYKQSVVEVRREVQWLAYLHLLLIEYLHDFGDS